MVLDRGVLIWEAASDGETTALSRVDTYVDRFAFELVFHTSVLLDELFSLARLAITPIVLLDFLFSDD
jgi:hypothetical protein